MGWSQAHQFCRQHNAYLASKTQITLFNNNNNNNNNNNSNNSNSNNSNSSSLVWTSLTPLNGHYQWLSECPGLFPDPGVFIKWKHNLEPKSWNRECAGMDVISMEFQLLPCHLGLPVICFQDEWTDGSLEFSVDGLEQQQQQQQDDIELVLQADSNPSPHGILSLTSDQFAKIGLTCTAYNKTTGRPITRQPAVVWRKDLVYTGHCVPSLVPATLHDPTKSLSGAGSGAGWSVVTLQGTYWCEAWREASPQRVVSKGLLLLLQDWVVFVVAARRRERLLAPPTLDWVKENITSIFESSISDVRSLPLDLVWTARHTLPQDPAHVHAHYTFHLHVPRRKILTLLETVEEALARHAHRLLSALTQHTYLNSTRITFPALCLQHTEGGAAPPLQWPITPAGPVHPTNARCHLPGGRLVAATCRWNYTHGARVVFDGRGCEWRGLCPRGYHDLNQSHCLALAHPGPWGAGFRAVHTTGQEEDLLGVSEAGRSPVWQAVAGLAHTDLLWLPYRRIRPAGPLVPLAPHPGAHNHTLRALNVTWADGHPLLQDECLALNVTTHTLVTRECVASLPFPSLVVHPVLSTPSATHARSSALCPGWFSPVLRGPDEVCFKLLPLTANNYTWAEAQEACRRHDADLPTPNVAFLDWAYRWLMVRHHVHAVWMFTHLEGGHLVYSGPLDTVNWAATTDYSLPQGALTADGWTLLPANHTLPRVMCQRVLTSQHHLHLHVLPPQPPTHSLCVRANPPQLLAGVTAPDLQCFYNGRPVQVSASSTPGCVAQVTTSGPGYYQCVGWTTAPRTPMYTPQHLVPIPGPALRVTLLEGDQHYDPQRHDPTFSPWPACACCHALYKTLSTVTTNSTIFQYHLWPHHDGHLTQSLLLAHSGIQALLKAELAPGTTLPPRCVVLEVKDARGCEGEVTEGGRGTNLTWPSTEGSGQVLPLEPCVTLGGEAVTRHCGGDLLLGYTWGETDQCTGAPSPLTKQLWAARQSLERTEGVLAASHDVLQPVDVLLVAKSMQGAAHASATPTSLPQLVNLMDRVLDADATTILTAQQRLGSSDDLLTAFERLLLTVNSTGRERGPQAVSGASVAVHTLSLTPACPVVGYKSRHGHAEQTLTGVVTEADLSGADSAIVLPSNITQEVGGTQRAGQGVPLTFAVYRNHKLFQEGDEEEASLRQYRVNSEVVQASFDREVYGLPHPVKIYFKPRLPGNDTRCVFWDLRGGGRGRWSEDGCRWGGVVEGGLHVCLCDHLTCFAELINYNASWVFPERHAAALDAITTLGCCLSLLSYLLIFFTFALFRRWRRPLSNKILVQVCVAEAITLVVFVAGVGQTQRPLLCRAVAVTLHYSILASFAWMLVEAVHQYLGFVKVVGTYVPRFIWKASVCAWGVPVLPVLAMLVYDSSLYDHDGSEAAGAKICWLSSHGFRLGLLPPLVATMATCVVMYGLILHAVTCGRPVVSSTLPPRAMAVHQLRLAVCAFLLLGLSWLFGLLAVTSARLVFAYVFCVLATLKGFMLLLLHVCRERGARQYWQEFLSVLKQESSLSSPPDSAPRVTASFTPCGGIAVLPPLVVRRPPSTPRTSLLSARTSSTQGS